MARRGRESFDKLQRQRGRDEKAKIKAERKQERREADAATETDAEAQDRLLEEFREISERHDAGAMTDEDFAEARQAILEALGMETA